MTRSLRAKNQNLRFETFRADIVLRRIRKSPTAKHAAISFPMVFFLLLALVTHLEGNFVLSDWTRIVGSDHRRIVGGNVDSNIDAGFPLMRDSIMFFLYSLQIANMFILYRQWTILESLLMDLKVDGVISMVNSPSPHNNGGNDAPTRSQEYPDGEIIRAVSGVNQFFRAVGGQSSSESRQGHLDFRRSRCKLVPLVIFMLVLCFVSFILYGHIGPDTVFMKVADPSSKEAFKSWWASPENTFGQTSFVLTATIFIYYLIIQNIVGLRLVVFFWSNRHRMEMGADLTAGSQHFGWLPLRQLLWTIRWSVTLNACCLFVMVRLYFGWSTAALLGLFLFNVLYLLVPYVILARGIRVFRDRQISQLKEQGRDSSSIEDRIRIGEIREKLDLLTPRHILEYGKLTVHIVSTVLVLFVPLMIRAMVA